MKTGKRQQEDRQQTPIWRIAAVINFPMHLPAVPFVPGQTITAVSRIPNEPPVNFDGVYVTIHPWPNVNIPSLPYGPSGIKDEPAALVFFVADNDPFAQGKVYHLLESLMDSLSFQLQTAIHAYELQVLDMTPPVAAGMERNYFVEKYSSGKFIQSFPPSNIKTSLHPKLAYSLENASTRNRAALRWYIKGIAATYEVDKFIFFWTALEILRSESGISVSSPYRARCGHEIPNCPICGEMTLKEELGKSIKKFLMDRADISEDTAKKLWKLRQMIHGTKDLTYEELRDLPTMANSLRQALLTILKPALGWPLNAPPLILPSMGSAIIPSYNTINSKRVLDAHDIELGLQGSTFFNK